MEYGYFIQKIFVRVITYVFFKLLKKKLSDYSRVYTGKLYIYYLSLEDSGVYECVLPSGQSSSVRLTVYDPKDDTDAGDERGVDPEIEQPQTSI